MENPIARMHVTPVLVGWVSFDMWVSSVLTCDLTVVISFNYKSDHTVKLVKYNVNMFFITNSQI